MKLEELERLITRLRAERRKITEPRNIVASENRLKRLKAMREELLQQNAAPSPQG